jgi:hypothetical protein
MLYSTKRGVQLWNVFWNPFEMPVVCLNCFFCDSPVVMKLTKILSPDFRVNRVLIMNGIKFYAARIFFKVVLSSRQKLSHGLAKSSAINAA